MNERVLGPRAKWLRGALVRHKHQPGGAEGRDRLFPGVDAASTANISRQVRAPARSAQSQLRCRQVTTGCRARRPRRRTPFRKIDLHRVRSRSSPDHSRPRWEARRPRPRWPGRAAARRGRSTIRKVAQATASKVSPGAPVETSHSLAFPPWSGPSTCKIPACRGDPNREVPEKSTLIFNSSSCSRCEERLLISLSCGLPTLIVAHRLGPLLPVIRNFDCRSHEIDQEPSTTPPAARYIGRQRMRSRTDEAVCSWRET